MLCADTENVIVVHHGDWLRVRPLPPGIHVLTARDVNDESEPRLGHAMSWLYQRDYETGKSCITALKELCAQTDDPPMCLQGEKGGTVSSSIIALREPLQKSTWWHSQGPPDRAPYDNYSKLFAEIDTGY